MPLRLLPALLFCCLSGFAAAAAPIVDTEAVKAALARGVVVWDVRPTPLYRKGHLPGAVSIGDAGAVLRSPVTEDFVATEQIEKILGAAGIDPAQETIVYAERGAAYAYFGRFALRYFGGTNVSVYHDGVDGWVAAGNRLATDDTVRPSVALKLAAVEALAAGTDEVVKQAGKGAVQFIDARSVGEFMGEDVRAIRGGHIPGAINIPFERNWKDPDTGAKLARRQVPDNSGMALKTGDELKALYAKLDPDKETIVYCQSGVRAAETAAVLEQLGFGKVKVYDSSWLGYATRLDAPAHNETFFNVGAMNARLSGLQRRVDEMERMIAELHAGRANGAGMK